MQNNKAFSLIELSIVLIIIGLLIAGVVGGKKLIELSALSSARALTSSSPVAGTEDLALWFESTSKKSFNSGQGNVDGSAVTAWKDINPQSPNKQITSGGSATYAENAIGGLPAIRFNGTNSYLSFNKSFLTNNRLYDFYC